MTVTSDMPERRSGADLQRILEELIGDKESIRSGDLPKALLEFEKKHEITILQPVEYDGLQALCEQHADLELGATELFRFLNLIPRPQKAASTIIVPQADAPSSVPPTSFKPGAPPQHRRRHSDRIRSPSDSSSSSDEDSHRPFLRPASSSPAAPRAFPVSATATSFEMSGGPVLPKRVKTLSDSLKYESPLASRSKQPAGHPPSAFGGLGGGFARPSPASRRRRSSQTLQGGVSDSQQSPEIHPRFNRSTSGPSIHGRLSLSPSQDRKSDSTPSSPMSPVGLGSSSPYHRAKSPLGDEADLEEAERSLDLSTDFPEQEGNDHDVEDVASDPRLTSMATQSTDSLKSSHDKLRFLQKQNMDLTRKLKASENQLSLQGMENERLIEDLQGKLEEARAEISQRRRDEKDLKGKERALLIQVAGFEADIQSLQRSLDNAKENHANMQRMYNSQCDEASRLRGLLLDRDNEIHELEGAARGHEGETERHETEVKTLEAEIHRLEANLVDACEVESILSTQKQENLNLRETIDRMRFDLDEARAAAAGGRIGHSRLPTDGASNMGTLSKNLGDELSRRLAVPEVAQEDSEEEYETVVTTTTTKKRPARTSGPVRPIGISARDESVIQEPADAGSNADPVSVVPSSNGAGPSDHTRSAPPAYTPKSDPMSADEILRQAHPRAVSGDLGAELDEEYALLVDSVGLRCEYIENALQLQRQEGAKATSSSIKIRQPREGFANYKFHQRAGPGTEAFGRMMGWIFAALAIGAMAGYQLLAPPTGVTARDYQLFAHMNNLALASGAGEGFLPRGVAGFTGAALGAMGGRIPS